MKKRQKITYDQEVLILAREFLQHKLSAAGVSYVVTSRSKFRRNIWGIVLLATAGFMTYMTFKVVTEYLKYPKTIIKEDSIEPRLAFPAVTVCSLNPISNNDVEKTSLTKIKKLRDMLKTSTQISATHEVRNECYRDPMCRWSWFTELCSCMSTPCYTEYCVDNNKKKCKCSSAMCTKMYDDILMSGACDNGNGTHECHCNTDFRFSKEGGGRTDSRIAEVLKVLQDPDVKDIINIIEKSDLVDLTDVEEDLMPTSDDIYRFGTEFDRLVISCSFETRSCDKQNFTIFIHAQYGKCHTFNYVGDKSEGHRELLKIHNYGSSSGLNLLLQVERAEILELLSRELGIRVVVHDPKEQPYITEHGFNVRINDMTAVELSLSETTRLGEPWGYCMDDGSHLPFKYTDLRYNQLGCQKKCRDHYVQEKCNCTRRGFLRGDVVESDSSSRVSFCSVKNAAQSECLFAVLEDIEKGEINCNCYPPCREKQYKTSLSSANINEKFFRMVRGVKTLQVHGDGTSHSEGLRRSDLVGLKVYFRTLQVETFVEVPSYSWETLVANIGGNLGFFMGLSLVTFVEICEFFWDVFLSVVNWKKHKIHHTAIEQRKNSDALSLRSENPFFPRTLQSYKNEPITPLEGMIKNMLDVAPKSRDHFNYADTDILPRESRFSRRQCGARSFTMRRGRFARRSHSSRSKKEPVDSSTLSNVDLLVV